MKLSEIRQAFEDGSSAANAMNKKLIYSGIAIVWILKGGLETSIKGIPDLLLWALILFASSLALDLFQALLHTGIWYIRYALFKKQELTKPENANGLDEDNIVVNEKESWSIPTWIFWFLKILPTAAAYILIIIHLAKQL
jgi:hypothetical protein